MNISLIGAQIAKFRKSRGMTQEDLGRSVGVSTQAVSRWERGGAPDVGLLPDIADTLGVTVDALFGREGGTPENFEHSFLLWLRARDRKDFYTSLIRLLWIADQDQTPLSSELPQITVYPSSCTFSYSGGDRPPILMCTSVGDEEGFLLGAMAQDMSFCAVFPEPEAGYGAYLAANDDYRRLFSALALPWAMEVLLDMAGEKERLVLPVTEAKRLNAPLEEVTAALEAMRGANLLNPTDLELPDGPVTAYRLSFTRNFIPFLYFARYVGQSGEGYWTQIMRRTTPWLRRAGQTRNEENYEESFDRRDI